MRVFDVFLLMQRAFNFDAYEAHLQNVNQVQDLWFPA